MEFRKGKGVWLDLEKMAENPGPYTMSYGFNLDSLRESISRVGLMNPPLVARNQQGSFDIVSGYRRILAMKALGESKTLCEDVTSVLPSPFERFRANFYENLATRSFNDIEKALILHQLRGHLGAEEILASFMPLLSLPSHEGTLKSYLELLDLEENIKKAIAQEEISIKTGKALVEMEKDSRHTLFHWIFILKLNFNQQLKLIEYVRDITIREELSIPKLLSDGSFLEILEGPRLNTPQKAKAVLETLRVRRYPRLAEAQHAVEHAVSEIPMPPGASIQYDPYMEDPCYRLEIKFAYGKDLKITIEKLHALHELETIPELWTGK
jgi:hypothetical protein